MRKGEGMQVGDRVQCKPECNHLYSITGAHMHEGVITSIDGCHVLIRVLQHDDGALIGSVHWARLNSFVVISNTVHALDFTVHNHAQCEDCGELFDTMVNEDTVCTTCRSDNYCRCEWCEDWVHIDDATFVDGTPVCPTCFDRHYVTCGECNAIVRVSNTYTVDDTTYCSACFDDCCAYCDSCGVSVRRDDLYNRDEQCLCHDCCWEYDTEDEDEDVHAGSLRSHWAKLNPIFHAEEGTARDPEYGELYFGMELEMEVPSGVSRSDVADAICDADERDWYLEEDRSLDKGIEVVTHPRTFESWQGFWSTFDRSVLGPARKRGCTGHDNDTCGIHIHTSLDAWDEEQLLRLFTLLYRKDNYQHILVVSQRKPSNLDRWASLDIKDISKAKLRRDVLDKRSPFAERYAALNITGHTLEIRIFNSSLRLDRVQKNLEFAYALYGYTADVQRVSWDGFMRWIKKHKTCVPNLYAFLVEKAMIPTQETTVPAVVEEELCA